MGSRLMYAAYGLECLTTFSEARTARAKTHSQSISLVVAAVITILVAMISTIRVIFIGRAITVIVFGLITHLSRLLATTRLNRHPCLSAASMT